MWGRGGARPGLSRHRLGSGSVLSCGGDMGFEDKHALSLAFEHLGSTESMEHLHHLFELGLLDGFGEQEVCDMQGYVDASHRGLVVQHIHFPLELELFVYIELPLLVSYLNGILLWSEQDDDLP